MLRNGDAEQAWEAANTAAELSAEIGYHWGRLDADATIASLS
jgi:hypothetical protein